MLTQRFRITKDKQPVELVLSAIPGTARPFFWLLMVDNTGFRIGGHFKTKHEAYEARNAWLDEIQFRIATGPVIHLLQEIAGTVGLVHRNSYP